MNRISLKLCVIAAILTLSACVRVVDTHDDFAASNSPYVPVVSGTGTYTPYYMPATTGIYFSSPGLYYSRPHLRFRQYNMPRSYIQYPQNGFGRYPYRM